MSVKNEASKKKYMVNEIKLTDEQRQELKKALLVYRMNRPNGCHEWRVAPKSPKTNSSPLWTLGDKVVHLRRVMWAFSKNCLPAFRRVHATCKNGACINIKHMELGPAHTPPNPKIDAFINKMSSQLGIPKAVSNECVMQRKAHSAKLKAIQEKVDAIGTEFAKLKTMVATKPTN